MRYRRHVLRDVFVLTLPIAAVLGFLVIATGLSFYRGEIALFHGYPVRSLRVGGLKEAIANSVAPLDRSHGRRFRPNREELAERAPDAPRLYDLRVSGTNLDLLRKDLPASAKEWVRGDLVEAGNWQKVDVRNRGQRMANYFWSRKAWRVRTDTHELVDGYRELNLSPLVERLDGHLTYLVARLQGIPAPRTQVAHLYLNEEDQGLYLQEEQVDESMVRRYGRMPGDIFYGELFVPDEPTMSADDLFWNPFLWRKNAVHNYFGDEHRPYLRELIEHVTSDDPAACDRIWDVLDRDAFVDYFAVLTFQGDQHIDHSHNHKLYFSPIHGRFEPFLWNPLINMPAGQGVETVANRLFIEATRDPRFLQSVHERVQRFLDSGMTAAMLAEIERMRQTYRAHALDVAEFDTALDWAARRVTERGRTVEAWSRHAALRYETARLAGRSGLALDVHVRSTALLWLTELEFDAPLPTGIELWEDRDFDGAVSAADRRLDVQANERTLRVGDRAAALYPGRDLRASYRLAEGEGGDSFAQHRQFSRLAWLRTRLLLVLPARGAGEREANPDAQPSLPAITSLRAERSVGTGEIDVRPGPPDGYVATRTRHPFGLPEPPAAKNYQFAGEVDLRETLVVHERDTFRAASGTVFSLGPNVSLVFRSPIDLSDLTFRRLDPERAWGAIAIQGQAAAGSVVARCNFTGGSHGVVDHVYYSGMFSVYDCDRVVLDECQFGPNLFGDDTVRFAECRDVLLRGLRIDRANGDAIDCDLSTGRIERALVTDPRNDGIDLMTAIVGVHDSEIVNAGDKGISFGEGANPEVTDVRIEGCVLGVGLKDGSDPILRRVSIRNCRIGIASYDKNWRYVGGGRGRLIDCVLEGNQITADLDSHSNLVLIDAKLEGRPARSEDFAALGAVEVLSRQDARARAPEDPRYAELFGIGKD